MDRIIIDARGAKRYLPEEFAICGTPKAIEELGRSIQAASRQLGDSAGGWVFVKLGHPASAPPSTKPMEWEDALPHKPSGGTVTP